MGYGHYSTAAYDRIRATKGYGRKSRAQIFTSRSIDPEMDPRTIVTRESRDSEDHPNSLPVIVALDVTGSMGFVPEEIVKRGLPKLMDAMLDAGIADPQVLFAGVGDFVYDRAPLQVGQFESSAELLDRWLTKVYLEGGGGGNNNESYNLAYLLAARHTTTDAWEKRRRKGFLITIGDEPCADRIPSEVIQRLTTGDRRQGVTTADILAEAQERYHVFHFHLVHDAPSKSEHRKQGWYELLGDRFVVLQNHDELSASIASVIVDTVAAEGHTIAVGAGPGAVSPESHDSTTGSGVAEWML